jgi:hypothetical protein
VLLDSILIEDLRRLLKDFLIGARNRKKARVIYDQHSLKERIFLGFIKLYIENYKLAFNCFHWLYMIEIIIIIPQYSMLIALYVTGHDYYCVLFILLFVKALLCISIRLQTDSLRRSRFRQGK